MLRTEDSLVKFIPAFGSMTEQVHSQFEEIRLQQPSSEEAGQSFKNPTLTVDTIPPNDPG